MKVIYDGEYDVTGFYHRGEFIPLRKGENEVPDGAVRGALKIDGASLPEGVKLPSRKKAKRKPKATEPTPAVVIDFEGDS